MIKQKYWCFVVLKKFFNSIGVFFSFIFGNLLRICFVISVISIFLWKKNILLSIKQCYDKYVNSTVLRNEQICENLVLDGIRYSNYQFIQEKINEFCNNDNRTIEWLRDEISKDIWIKSLSIRKNYGNSLIINVIEYTPFAIWIRNNKDIYLIDQMGTIINVKSEELAKFDKLLILKGEGFNSEDLGNFFNLFLTYNDISIDLKEIERIGNRRWNLIFKNGIVVKFPEGEKNVVNAWSNLNKLIQYDYIMNDIEEIDLRINGKIYLKYEDDIVKKLKIEIE